MTGEKAPGRSTRKGISMVEAMRMFPHDAAAEQLFDRVRRPQGPDCEAGSRRVQSGARHKTTPFCCRSCRRRFSVRTGTVMADAGLGYRTWALAIYLFSTCIKSVSSMKLHRDLDIAQNFGLASQPPHPGCVVPRGHRVRRSGGRGETSRRQAQEHAQRGAQDDRGRRDRPPRRWGCPSRRYQPRTRPP